MSRLCSQLENMKRSLNTLEQNLQQLATHLNTADPAAPIDKSQDKSPVEPIWQQSLQLLPQFLEILELLDTTERSLTARQQIQTYQTEAHRRLRLLQPEAMRLRTARQKATLDKGCAQLLAHVCEIEKFVAAIAQEVCPSTTADA